LLLKPLDKPRVADQLWPHYRAMVKVLFRERRKQLGTLIKKYYSGGDSDLLEVLASGGLDLSRRPETLSIEEMAQLAAALPKTQS
jgi:16S rRNA A1518/A1519 N6-dimethyltransferase RsmA/KsgA/DIM1 with predicted DNA glycosylase/AP lyase activity